MSNDLVRDYYAAFGEREWQRLDRPEGVIEFAVVSDALRRHLPPGGRILDVGGGPGRWAIWLAERGFTLTLVDLSPNLIDVARAKVREAAVESRFDEIAVGDACDLSRFADASFDAVLCLGPLYHLTAPADRDRAASEVVRVLKPGTPAFIAFMPVYTFLGRTLSLKDESHHLAQPDFVARLMDDGVFLNDVPGRFNSGYAVSPQEVAPFLERHGLRTVELLSDTGFAAPYAMQLQELALADPAAYEKVIAIIVATAADPSILGAAVHLVYVGRKEPSP